MCHWSVVAPPIIGTVATTILYATTYNYLCYKSWKRALYDSCWRLKLCNSSCVNKTLANTALSDTHTHTHTWISCASKSWKRGLHLKVCAPHQTTGCHTAHAPTSISATTSASSIRTRCLFLKKPEKMWRAKALPANTADLPPRMPCPAQDISAD